MPKHTKLRAPRGLDPEVKEEFDRIAAELTSILEEHDTTATVIYCDSRIANIETFTHDDLPLTLNPAGGGGTDFAPAFKMLDETHEDVSAFIYFTDGEARMPKEEPLVPTLWAITTPQALHERICADWNFAEMPTFGEVIYLGDEG